MRALRVEGEKSADVRNTEIVPDATAPIGNSAVYATGFQERIFGLRRTNIPVNLIGTFGNTHPKRNVAQMHFALVGAFLK